MHWGFRAPGDPGRQAELAAALVPAGFDWVEVDAPLEPDPDYARHLRGFRQQWGLELSIHCHFVDVNPSSVHPRVRERALEILRQDIAFAGAAGARVAVMHPGDIGWFDFFPADHPQYREGQDYVDELFAIHTESAALALAELGDFAAGQGVLLTWENMYNPWDILCRPAEMAALLTRHPLPQTAVILDTGHAMVAGYRPADFVGALGGRIGHTHIHWNDGKYDIHLPLGPESVPELRCLRELVRQRPEICLLIELPYRHPGEFVQSLAALRAAVTG